MCMRLRDSSLLLRSWNRMRPGVMLEPMLTKYRRFSWLALYLAGASGAESVEEVEYRRLRRTLLARLLSDRFNDLRNCVADS